MIASTLARGDRRPWKAITTNDPEQTLGEGEITHHETLIAAANKLAKAKTPFGTVIFDDGCTVRELTDREHQLVANVCDMLGVDVEPPDAA